MNDQPISESISTQVKKRQETTFNQVEQSEIFEFYQNQLAELKELLYKQNDQLTSTQSENKSLSILVSNLKENNSSLTYAFNDIQKSMNEKVSNLEERLATMSVSRAEKEMQIDTINYDLCKLRKQCANKDEQIRENELITNNFRKQIEALNNINSDDSMNNSQNLDDESSDRQFGSMSSIISPPKKMSLLSAQHYNMSNDEFIQLKQQNQSYISLVDSLKNALNKGETIREKKKNDLKMMMDNLPSSAYQILYEEEMNKLNDTKTKAGEILIWEQEVMNLFLHEKKNEARIQEKISSYIRNFFPEQFRGKLWKSLVGNKIHITKLLYNKILETIPSNPIITEELLHLINSDLKRTFQLINNYADEKKLKDDLREVLMVWSLYRPDIGYVQGMTYLAFMFLLRMDKIKTFKCFSNLLIKSGLVLALYSFNHNKIEAYFQTFNYFLNEKLPDVSKHMAFHEIPKQAFLVEWFYTIFARAFNLIISSKVWDYFLFEGDVYIYRLCFGIFNLIQADLLKCSYEDTLLMIRNCSLQLNEQQLFKSVAKFKLTKSLFQQRYEKELSYILEGNPDVQKIL